MLVIVLSPKLQGNSQRERDCDDTTPTHNSTLILFVWASSTCVDTRNYHPNKSPYWATVAPQSFAGAEGNARAPQATPPHSIQEEGTTVASSEAGSVRTTLPPNSARCAASVNLTKAILGLGITALPRAFGMLGILPAIAVLCLTMALTYASCMGLAQYVWI